MNYVNGTIEHLCVKFFLPLTIIGFHYFCDKLIETIFIIDSLNFVYENANTRFDLRKNMVNRGITVLKHDNLFICITMFISITSYSLKYFG